MNSWRGEPGWEWGRLKRKEQGGKTSSSRGICFSINQQGEVMSGEFRGRIVSHQQEHLELS